MSFAAERQAIYFGGIKTVEIEPFDDSTLAKSLSRQLCITRETRKPILEISYWFRIEITLILLESQRKQRVKRSKRSMLILSNMIEIWRESEERLK